MKNKLRKLAGIANLFNQIPSWFIVVFIGIVYLTFSLVYSYERILNTDCSYQLFNIINNKTFFFQEYRYGVFLSQIPF